MADPEKRPTFKDIVRTLTGYTESLAGYLDMTYNPFAPLNDQKVKEDGFNNDILTRPDQLAALFDDMPRKSPRSSPRASPRASPRVSPMGTPTSVNRGCLLPEILIDEA